MNSIIKRSLCICTIALCIGGCTKYINEQPDSLLTTAMIWQTATTAEEYLNQVYSNITVAPDDPMHLGGVDETSCPYISTNVRQMVMGNWSAQNQYVYNWPVWWQGIRQSLVFEASIGSVPASLMGDSLKAQHIGETEFLRGWFYWNLLRQYGPFPILRSVLSTSQSYNDYEQAPFDSCVAEINRLMDLAAANLPAAWQSSANYGRPTKGACLAIKAEVALLAASPLWNGDPMYSSFKNKSGTLLAPATYDAAKWQTAAAAAKAVIDLGAYKLHYNTDDGDATFDPLLSYRGTFIDNWNSEIIFATAAAVNNWIWGEEIRCCPSPAGLNMQNATQNVVDSFYMRNGLSINDPGSGYNEQGFAQQDDPAQWGMEKDGVNRGYIAGNSNMYVGREARFYAAIQYNGKPVTPAPTIDDRNYFSSPQNQDGRGRAEFYYSGLSGVGVNSGNADITGYNVLKFTSPATDMRISQVAYRPYIHLRYAQILLDYVEALNEYDPGNPDIITYLDMVRARAGLPGYETVYPDRVGNQAAMRYAILRERQIELCFEGDRYWTLIRRLMMGTPTQLNIYRMNVGTNDNGQGFAFTGYNTRELLQTRVWDNKMYLFPIYQNDLETTQGLVQNPGW